MKNLEKERAWEIIRVFQEEASATDFVKAVVLVGSLSDDTYTGRPGSDIDLVTIIRSDCNYWEAKQKVLAMIDKVEEMTNRDIPIARVIYNENHLKHPYWVDFEVSEEDADLVNLPIEVFRMLDSGKIIYGEDIISGMECPTREDVVESMRLNEKLERLYWQKAPEKMEAYKAMRANPTTRILAQIVLVTALSEYFYYTGKSCSSKFHILQKCEQEVPDLSYLELLRLCHRYRFAHETITESEEEKMHSDYRECFLTRPVTWSV
ncbi:hypothetical protein SAMN02910358_01141 [Lachnospiraceae bacterium XBB1006]|nr:hypothetical protein SAMN02910358_01141 [Lachnospiraceae bacterium XBB1006]